MHCTSDRVLIEAEDAQRWELPFSSLSLRQTDPSWRELTLRGTSQGGEAVVFEAPAVPLLKVLEGAVPSSFVATLGELPALVRAANARSRRRYTPVVCFVVLLAATLWAMPWLAVRLVPLSWERSLGQQAFALQAPTLGPEVQTPEVLAAVHTLVERVQTGLPGHPYTFEVHVVDSSQVNACAFPGGIVVVHTGLLARASSPEHVAGVLAHEMVHVVKRHSVQALASAARLETLASLLGMTGDPKTSGSKILTRLSGLAWSRSQEREADLEGLHVLVRAGIDPRPLAEFLGELDAGWDLTGLTSDHPRGAERRLGLLEELARQPAVRFKPLGIEYATVRARLPQYSGPDHAQLPSLPSEATSSPKFLPPHVRSGAP